MRNKTRICSWMLVACCLAVAGSGITEDALAEKPVPAKQKRAEAEVPGMHQLALQAVEVRNTIATSYKLKARRASSFWRLGLRSMEDGQYEAACVFFEAFLLESDKNKELSGGHYWLGRAEEALGNYGVSKRHLEKANTLSRWGYYGVLAQRRLTKARRDTQGQCERENEFLGESPNLGLALATRRKLNRFFPQNYVKLLSKVARRYKVDSSWLVALSRQESAFRSDVVSRAGAIGLLQIMPETANGVLRRKADRLLETSADLFKPELNAVIGTIYFRKLLRRFKGDEAIALAAYNAGPNAASRWLSRWAGLDSELLVERIPYEETQTYVKRVTEWQAKFKSLQDSNYALAQNARAPSILASAGNP